MEPREKYICIAALITLITIPPLLFIIPKLHTLPFLIPLSFLLIGMNAALLFLVFKDIFTRRFNSDKMRLVWAALVFFFPPVILLYLPLHGFRARQ